jgi:hypothetical protein
MLDPTFDMLGRVAFAALFAAAAVHKLRTPETFAASLADYRVLPLGAVRPATVAIPLIELAAAIGCLAWPTGLVGAAGLLLVYAAAIAVNLIRGRGHIDCGCHWGSQRSQPIEWALVVRNGLLAGVGAAIAVAPRAMRQIEAGDLMTIVFGAGFLVVAYASIGQFWSNRNMSGVRS